MPASAARARALVTKSMWEDARRAGGAGGRACRATRRSGASVLRLLGAVGNGVRRPRLPRGRPLGATPLRAPRSPDRSGQDRPHPVLRSDGRARRRPAGRGRDARAQARHRRLTAEHAPRGSCARRPPLRRGGARALGRGATASAPRRAGRRRQPGHAVRARSEDAPLVCRRVRRARSRRRGAATRGDRGRAGLSKTATWVSGSTRRRRISHCCEATSNGSTRCSSRPARRGNWSPDGSLYALATKLDALIALGRTSEAEEAATPLLRAGDVSRAVRAAYARSRAERPRPDRTGGRALRGDGARLARGEDGIGYRTVNVASRWAS